MARNGLIKDNRVIWAPEYPLLPSAPLRPAAAAAPTTEMAAVAAAGAQQQPSCAATVLNVYALATDVCGHKGVVHGGLSSALLDESFGYLLYLLASTAAEKESRALRPELPSAALKSAMTAHLEVDFVRVGRAVAGLQSRHPYRGPWCQTRTYPAMCACLHVC